MPSATRRGAYTGIAACTLFVIWAVVTGPLNVNLGFNFRLNTITIGILSNAIMFTVGYIASKLLGGPRKAVVGASSMVGAAMLIFLFATAPRAASAPASAANDPAPAMTNSIGMKLVRIEPGSFVMGEGGTIPAGMLPKEMEYATHGDWDERPLHKVTLTKPFYLSETEVTVEQFRQFKADIGAASSSSSSSSPEPPYIIGISWYEAQAFCEWLSKKEGRTYRLPTEAEWEYGARGTARSFARPPAAAPPMLGREEHASRAGRMGARLARSVSGIG